MNYTTLYPCTPNSEGVCLVGIGREGRQFVADLLEEAPAPLVESLGLASDGQPSESTWLVDLKAMAVAFVTVSLSATSEDILTALQLLADVRPSQTYVVGVLIHSRHQQSAPTLGLDRVIERFDAQIDFHSGSPDSPAGRASIGWFVAALAKLCAEGILIYEPAWDRQDLTEELGMPGTGLGLVSIQEGAGDPLDTAIEQALKTLVDDGIDLDQVNGVMLIVWPSPRGRVTIAQARAATDAVTRVLGVGSLHMTLRLGTRSDWPGVAVGMTMVVSMHGRRPWSSACWR